MKRSLQKAKFKSFNGRCIRITKETQENIENRKKLYQKFFIRINEENQNTETVKQMLMFYKNLKREI